MKQKLVRETVLRLESEERDEAILLFSLRWLAL